MADGASGPTRTDTTMAGEGHAQYPATGGPSHEHAPIQNLHAAGLTALDQRHRNAILKDASGRDPDAAGVHSGHMNTIDFAVTINVIYARDLKEDIVGVVVGVDGVPIMTLFAVYATFA